MTDLAVITANLAHDRVAEQFAAPAVPAAAARTPVRRIAVRSLRAVADRLEPAPKTRPALAGRRPGVNPGA